MSGYLVDTSVFIAGEQRRSLGDPPEGEARISVATLTELATGVARARNAIELELREFTYARARAFIALPYDESVVKPLAEILTAARNSRVRVGAMDAIIAATALAHGLTVWTQGGDFELLKQLVPRLRVASA